ncbi:hypothetical protein [Legionella cardiaca]|uniref:Glutathione synthase/Ribosomal protein S6 modification enzyme (Glutaminyl transferase) n=1 Tax=Legionella cardiaca TaxID=1071983 RepID=A0ABY8AUZ3_9GAMM|nr:hypothetical protein [Legionella cardiaca]WED42952.1 hypothetical protein PXX05_13770 [Legionella cardiaca]
MKVLIVTEPDDMHAVLVKIALEKIDHHVKLLFIADQPTKQKNSVYINDNDFEWQSSDKYYLTKDNDYDVVWWRRVRKPYVPKAMIHPKDYRFAVRENSLFYESLIYNMAPNAWWINDKEVATRTNSKLLQLRIAGLCGMKVPTTLCSNNPKDIRHFLLKNEAAGVIYKPLCANFWFEEKQTKISYTTKIKFMDLPNNQLLQLVPGIFQKEIKKKYELRVTCFGDYLVAVKLNSQEHKDGYIDWRAIPRGIMAIEPYHLPSELARKIRLFMQKMGLVFGAFDFIVTPGNEYIFLEVNEQGQFLWIEEYNSELKMLDIFVNFLVSRARDFMWDSGKAVHTIERYRRQMEGIILQNMQRHVDLNRAKIHNEMEQP